MYLSDINSGSEVYIKTKNSQGAASLFDGITARAPMGEVLVILFEGSVNAAKLATSTVTEVIWVDKETSNVYAFSVKRLTVDEHKMYELHILEDSMGITTDRRVWPRYAVDWNGAVTSSLTGVSSPCHINDISRFGLNFSASCTLPKGDIVDVQFVNKITKQKVKVRATIAWTQTYVNYTYLYGCKVDENGQGLQSLVDTLDI